MPKCCAQTRTQTQNRCICVRFFRREGYIHRHKSVFSEKLLAFVHKLTSLRLGLNELSWLIYNIKYRRNVLNDRFRVFRVPKSSVSTRKEITCEDESRHSWPPANITPKEDGEEKTHGQEIEKSQFQWCESCHITMIDRTVITVLFRIHNGLLINFMCMIKIHYKIWARAEQNYSLSVSNTDNVLRYKRRIDP